MHLFTLLPFVAYAAAAPKPPHHDPQPLQSKSNIICPIIFDGRVTKNMTLTSFDSAATSPYGPDYVKGENTSWSSILLLPKNTDLSRFDNPGVHKPLEITIDNRSLFRAGENLQVGFRRAGLLLKDDANDPGADAADSGVVTFHWSVKQDAARPMNLSHEYMNVWHEKADYSGNQFMFVGGTILPGDGGAANYTRKEREKWRIQNAKNEFIFDTRISEKEWQNFGVQLNYVKKCVESMK
jgi:hypothetical protein